MTTELFRHIKHNLFEGMNYICNLSQEFIIDSIPVFIKLLHCRRSRYVRLILYNINIMRADMNEDDDHDYNLLNDLYLIRTTGDIDKDIGSVITELQLVVGKLRFDKYLGRFVKVGESNFSVLESEILGLFKCFEHVKPVESKRAGDCCVCLDKTLTIPECGHHICFACVVQMNHTITNIDIDDNPDGELELLCPICRTELVF